jgi:hypothetical protein
MRKLLRPQRDGSVSLMPSRTQDNDFTASVAEAKGRF